jgi:formylmethanofuran dehydrogenase subunit E
MQNIQALLEKSSQDHHHLCPRQVLGVRLGLLGLQILGFAEPPTKKQLLVILETDGCFADGVAAATHCAVGHRTLRVEDLGKIAAVFVDVVSEQAVRIAPCLDVREKANRYAPDEPRHYFAQLQAYQTMPDHEMFQVTPVLLRTPVKTIISRPGVRVHCGQCGEEVINEREVKKDGAILCRSCAGYSFYETLVPTTVNAVG